MKIRRALPDDLSFVLAAAQRLGSFEPPAWRPAQEIVEGERRTLRAFFDAPPAGSALLIADSDQGEGLGFAYLERLQDYFTQQAHGHVGILVVTEAAAGKGVGGALVRARRSLGEGAGILEADLDRVRSEPGSPAGIRAPGIRAGDAALRQGPVK